MRGLKRSALLAGLLTIFIFPPVIASGEKVYEVDSKTIHAPAKPKAPFKTAFSIMPRIPSETVEIQPPNIEKVLEEDRIQKNRNCQKALSTVRVGVDVDIAPVSKEQWRLLDNSGVWRVVLHAPGARFIRPHFTSFPEESVRMYLYGEKQRRFYGPVRKPYWHDSGNDYWAPTVFGEYLYIESHTGSPTSPPVIDLDKISYGYRDIFERDITIKEADCYVDVNCRSAYATVSKGVIRYSFQRSGYSCGGAPSYGMSTATGVLLNDETSNDLPWVLTANHAICTETQADTVEAWFNYKSEYCGSDWTVEPDVVSGADYICGSSGPSSYVVGSDFSLIKLSGYPSGTTLLGWTNADLSGWEDVAVIHHPDGAYMRLSLGYRSIWTDAYCWIIYYNEGSSEEGSSGGPLLRVSDKKVVGQLSHGEAACGNSNEDYYGKFSVAWSECLSNYLLAEISSFEARACDGSIALHWTTSLEPDNSGWNVYRKESHEDYKLINDGLIPGLEYSYEYKDHSVQNGRKYYYKIEDVDLDGTKTMHGPVWAIPSPADIDESRRVDGADLIMLCAAMDSEPESDNWNEKADMNGNDIVDKDDLEIFYEYYGMVLSGK